MSLSEFLSLETFECEPQSGPPSVLSHLLLHNDAIGNTPFCSQEKQISFISLPLLDDMGLIWKHFRALGCNGRGVKVQWTEHRAGISRVGFRS